MPRLKPEKNNTFCPAKWLQLHLHLHNGRSHSCHYPPSHQIDLGKALKSPSAIHYTPTKIGEMKKMMKGEKPNGCAYCWKLEAKGLESPRLTTESQSWFQETKYQAPAPTYIEVSFSRVCQMKCLYCNPASSTAIESDYVRHGALPFTDGLDVFHAKKMLKRDEEEKSNLRKAFFQYLEEIKGDLKTLRITGGEPLLHEETFQIIASNSDAKFELGINTNLMVSEKIWKRFLSFRINQPKRSLTLFTSIDSSGLSAEYIRDGLSYQLFMLRLQELIKQTNDHVVIMITFSIFSLEGMKRLISDLASIDGKERISLSFSLVNYPSFLSPLILGEMTGPLLEEIKESIESSCFKNHVKGMEIFDCWRGQKKNIEEINKLMVFISEYDRRRNHSFKTAFPLLEEIIFHPSHRISTFHQQRVFLKDRCRERLKSTFPQLTEYWYD